MTNEEITKEFNIEKPKNFYTTYETSRILNTYPINIFNWFRKNDFKAIILPSGVIKIPHEQIPTLSNLKKERCFNNDG